jgi:hypothetical protein
MILSMESKGVGNCFHPSYKLSAKYVEMAYNTTLHNYLFNGKTLLNWAMFSSPRHPYLYAIMEAMVDVVRSSYLGKRVFYSTKGRKEWRTWYEVICGTGPKLVTSALRDMIAAGKNSQWRESVRIADTGFGGQFKATWKVPGWKPYTTKPGGHKHFKEGMVQFLKYYRK